MANESGSTLFTFDTAQGTADTGNVPYGFVGITFDSTSNSIIGNLISSPQGSNQLASYSLTANNASALGQAFQGMVCGASVSHAGIDLTNDIYYTVCCYDSDGCVNATLVAISIPSNKIVDIIPIELADHVYTGLYWIPPS